MGGCRVISPLFHRSGRARLLPQRPVVVELAGRGSSNEPPHVRDRTAGNVRVGSQHPVDSSALDSSPRETREVEFLRGAQVFVAYRTIVRVLLVVSALTVVIGQAMARDIVPPALALAGSALAEVVCSFAASRAVARFAVLGSVLGRGGDPLPRRVK